MEASINGTEEEKNTLLSFAYSQTVRVVYMSTICFDEINIYYIRTYAFFAVGS